MFNILAIFGRDSRQRRKPASGFWRIDLKSLGGPMTALARETLNLPRKSRKPREAPPRAQPVQQQHAPQRHPPEQYAPQLRAQHPQAEPPLSEHYAPQLRAQHPQAEPPLSEHYTPQLRSPHAEPPLARRQHRRPSLARERDYQQPDRDAFLAVHGIEKSFGGRKVVKGVSLYVRRGEAVGLLGPNGAGKTTVFYMITGLIKQEKGRIDLDGYNISGLPMYQRARLGIGYLPQEASIFRGLTVEDNIRSVLEIVEPNRRRREADLNALLDEFNITSLRKTPSIALSGGERRRVEIARALASRPNYMLLDEPFAGIDPIAVGDIQALVRHLTNRGIGVLITDHNVRETLGLTDRAYIIYSGEVLMEGRTEDIVNDPEVRRLYLGEDFSL